MSYSYTFDGGPTFNIRPEPHLQWGIYVDDEQIIVSHDPFSCIEMVARHNAMRGHFHEDLIRYGEHLPVLGNWETIADE